MNDSRLKGRIALITGASRGIGRAISKLFSQEGAKVAINYYRSEKDALSLEKEILKKGGEVFLVKADVSQLDEVKRMVQKVIERFGGIDILVNNAGILIPTAFLDCTEEIWNQTMAVNLKSVYLCSKEVAPIMINQEKGKIINMASISGLGHSLADTNTPYAVSKAGMVGLTRSLAVNLGPNINVNVICPGLIETDMILSIPPERRSLAIEESLLKRSGKPKEIACAALFLASDESDFITGEILTVSGGRAMR